MKELSQSKTITTVPSKERIGIELLKIENTDIISHTLDTTENKSYDLNYENIETSPKDSSISWIPYIIDTINNHLENTHLKKFKKIILYTIVEFWQNIEKHWLPGNNYIRYHQDNKNIALTFKNQYIEDWETQKKLESSLLTYSSLDNKDLKELYQNKLHTTKISEKWGAWLWLIDVFRKVKRKNWKILWNFYNEEKNEDTKENIRNFKIIVKIPIPEKLT